MSEHEELSWMVLPDRHPVLASDGSAAGYAAAVLGDHSNGRFDGVVVGIDVRAARDPRLMLEVDQIDLLDTEGIHTKLTAEQLRELPEYQADQAWKVSRKGKVDRAIETDGSSAWDKD